MTDTFDLSRYLKRIGYDGPVAPDLATLAAIHAAHADHVPFEGIDPFLRRPVRLDLASLWAKLIEGRRGGYCFEQNILLKTALAAMGFAVTGLTARVRWMSQPGSPLGPRVHMLLKVDLPDGAYLADAGFGACVLDAPLRFETGVEQQTARGTFQLTRDGDLFCLSAKQPAGWRSMYVFDLEPQIQADYELGNWYASTHPQSRFLDMLVAERCGRDRRYKLMNRRFVIEDRDGRIVHDAQIDNAEAFARVLGETFNIESPIPASELFARVNK